MVPLLQPARRVWQRRRDVCCWHHHLHLTLCKKFLAGPNHTLNYPWGTQKKTGKGLGWCSCLALCESNPRFGCLALSSLFAFPEQLYAFSCGSFPSMNDYSNKIVSSRNVLPLGQFWSIYEPARCCCLESATYRVAFLSLVWVFFFSFSFHMIIVRCGQNP